MGKVLIHPKIMGETGYAIMKYRGDKIGKVTIHSTIGQGTMVAFQAKLG